MISNKHKILDAILEQGMLPLFYQDSETGSVEILRTLYKAGVRVFEYTNRGKSALPNFKKLKEIRDAEMPDLYLGIGTIKTPADANAFIEAGTDFIVAPIVNPAVAEIANKIGMLWIPGCMTPTEISIAQEHKAMLIKIFPANILGPEFISSIKDLFAGQLFMPTGGVEINADNLKTWFKAGVCAVGMGSKLISKEVMNKGLYEELSENTKLALDLIKQSK
ncbi:MULTISPECIES: bifunctional 4-hydroxy-2-oxoglutarate aldolase/2-dehydro-3-deoxy-phosphogluconate aldolase [unclassified Pedobacter]|uniref:bifunctional 4-hydroxy-2-oxoglutarate aldolase/2-dehydro-3-deoxy-phosphogluconate aldolase n=1 Tax=Pedobacter TaxID=84567 RepID=UPI001554A6CC|nr:MULTISPECIES: bifunctional 4-hydroxy-2-oxoglutarate aldolase/2-dehydro-3-deoxy-phosphogluconate aldolase [unclassified Pedobacter]MCX2431741.1 bifunctional 4-hydroxy-2-oxoglutarate aldolase/2-dehydro-3-deoxy-phosphogluconate aldolase [Pedobacter sp. GR22-10]MCX2582288.1 bifunctional 4-hydroxy-2-oxoglutarate aldolase/2-dehydro-3-deoxy-phosphogluconate aldolase [Pedobacter sp. MR22-3]